jgi:hypothetical protein
MTQLAIEEHAQLSGTIRERLITRIVQGKNRLLKEKEHLDIADSNALLLNPGQFSIMNPASPGPASRKTRNTRHRGEDELEKRKRKAIYDDETPDDRGSNQLYREVRSRLEKSQVDSPVYSIDKLFTERELSVHINSAALAATQHFKAIRDRENGIEPEPVQTNGVEAEEEDSPAPEMERVSSHLTRSTRGNQSALALLGTVASQEAVSMQALAPALLSTLIAPKAGQAAPSLAGIRQDEAEAELKLVLGQVGKGNVDKEMLQEALDGLNGPNGNIAPVQSSSKPHGQV